MFKRIMLFAVINIAFMVTISIAAQILGVNDLVQRIGGNAGLMLFCLFWGFAGSFLSLLLSKKMAIWTLGVELIDVNEAGYAGDVVRMVHGLAREAGLTTMPEVGVYPSMEVNAFATGPSRNRSLIAVSRGLLCAMNRDEVEGVLAHEVSHIANGDMVTMTLIQGVVNAFVMFFARIAAQAVAHTFKQDDREGPNPFLYHGVVILFEIVFGLLGTMIVMWFSRLREYRADAGAASIAGRSKMIAALNRIRSHMEGLRTEDNAIATLKIAGPRASGLAALFRTHPSIEQRINALRAAV